MAELLVDGDFVETEPGFFDQSGVALSFFYYRNCDRASDIFLDVIGLGAEARHAINRSNYTAVAGIDVLNPVSEGEALRFSVQVDRIGGKSLTYRVLMQNAEDGAVRAVFNTVGVCMDMTGPTPMTIPDDVRAVISQYMAE